MRGWGIVSSGVSMIRSSKSSKSRSSVRSPQRTVRTRPNRVFDLLEDVEQRERVERRLEHGGGVQEQPLTRRAADRFGLMERADLPDDHARRAAKAAIAPSSVASAVAQIAAQTDQASDGHDDGSTEAHSFSLPIRSTASISRGVSTVKAARM